MLLPWHCPTVQHSSCRPHHFLRAVSIVCVWLESIVEEKQLHVGCASSCGGTAAMVAWRLRLAASAQVQVVGGAKVSAACGRTSATSAAAAGSSLTSKSTTSSSNSSRQEAHKRTHSQFAPDVVASCARKRFCLGGRTVVARPEPTTMRPSSSPAASRGANGRLPGHSSPAASQGGASLHNIPGAPDSFGNMGP